MTRPRKVAFILTLALLPAAFYWRGYIEVYSRIPDADLRIDGRPAGYAHRGPGTTIITRTDVPGGYSYRIWHTGAGIMLLDCHNWTAPDRRYFLQGNISAPCASTASAPDAYSALAPASSVKDAPGALRFSTKDGKLLSIRRAW